MTNPGDETKIKVTFASHGQPGVEVTVEVSLLPEIGDYVSASNGGKSCFGTVKSRNHMIDYRGQTLRIWLEP